MTKQPFIFRAKKKLFSTTLVKANNMSIILSALINMYFLSILISWAGQQNSPPIKKNKNYIIFVDLMHGLGRKGTMGCLLHQSLKFYYDVFLFVDLTILNCQLSLIGRFIKMIVQTFQPLIVIYRRVNFVYHH